jgi:hypothetical protein
VLHKPEDANSGQVGGCTAYSGKLPAVIEFWGPDGREESEEKLTAGGALAVPLRLQSVDQRAILEAWSC